MRGGAQPAGEKSSGNDKAADASRPHGCAVVPAGLMPRGLFAALPATGKGETDATSLNARRKPDHPAHAPMAAHMAESGAKSKRLMLQCSIARKMSSSRPNQGFKGSACGRTASTASRNHRHPPRYARSCLANPDTGLTLSERRLKGSRNDDGLPCRRVALDATERFTSAFTKCACWGIG